MRELICVQFYCDTPVTPIPMCCLRFIVVKKIYQPNSDSKYVLGKVHLYFFWRGEGGGRGEGRDENIRALLAGRFFLPTFARHLQFFYTPYISN